MSALSEASATWMPGSEGRPACAGHDPDIWFPGESAGPGASAAAKAICRSCPLRRSCAEYAIPLSGLVGVWGGLSQKERAAERRRREVRAGISVCTCGHHRTSHRAPYGHSSRRLECDQCDCRRYVLVGSS